MKRHTLLAPLLLLTGAALAAPPSLQLPMKLDYTEGVTMRSKSAERIEASDNAEAKQKLSLARENYAEARKAQNEQRFDDAERLANEALRLVTAAAQLVPNEVDKKSVEQRRHKELLAQIDTYHGWSSETKLNAETQQKLNKIELDIERAKKVADEGDLAQGNEILSNVLSEIIAIKNGSLESRTFKYDLNFETPIDEYRYELSRNDDYRRLVPIAITQKQPSAGIRTLMDRFVEKAEIARHDAEAMFEQKQYEQAVKSMQASSEQLISALKIAGVR